MLPLHFTFDGFRLLMIGLTCYLWLVTTLFSVEYFKGSSHRTRYGIFNLLTLCAIIGIFLSANFITLFVFFEVMSLTSYVLIAHTQQKKALRAAQTTLAVSIISGLILLMGLLLLDTRLEGAVTMRFADLFAQVAQMSDPSTLLLPALLMLVGFGAKAGMYPLHIWLPKAHPVAPAPASALLSGILTKTGVFGVLAITTTLMARNITWGTVLMVIGAVTMLWGALRALFSDEMKKTLACSTVSQIGFITVGIAMISLLGADAELAVRGVILHILNHALLKLVLFIAAGVVYLNRHDLSYDVIRGFGRGKPLFTFIMAMASLGLAGITFWSVYLSKTLLHESIIEAVEHYHGLSLQLPLQILNVLFLLTGGLTIAYMTRLFVALCVDKTRAPQDNPHSRDGSPYMTRPTAIALTATALLFPLLGTFYPLMDAIAHFASGFFPLLEPEAVPAVHYFSWINEQGMVISLLIGVLAYFAVVRGVLDRRGGATVAFTDRLRRLADRFDLEEFLYRPLLTASATVLNIVAHAGNVICDFDPKLERKAELPTVVGRFSAGLLFVGWGILLALLYVFMTNPYLR